MGIWSKLFGKTDAQLPAPRAPAAGPEPQQLAQRRGVVFLAQLVADLADGKRRGEVAGADVLARLDGLWRSGHERLAIEWMDKLLSVPEVPVEATAPLRALLVERLEQRGELDEALSCTLEGLTAIALYVAARALPACRARSPPRGSRARVAPLRGGARPLDVDYPNVRCSASSAAARQQTGRGSATDRGRDDRGR